MTENNLLTDDDYELVAQAVSLAREVQEFIWDGCYPTLRPYDAEGWRRLFQKRVDCIAAVDLTKSSGLAALRKRLLQQAALSIKALALVNRWSKSTTEAPVARAAMEEFRRSVGFQFGFVTHSGLDVATAVEHICSAAEKLITTQTREAQPQTAAACGALDTPLDCPMCGASKAFLISPLDEAVGYCFAEQKAWRITSLTCATAGCLKPKATFGDYCTACLEDRVNAEVTP